MSSEDAPLAPSLPWRAASTMIMGVTGILAKGLISGANQLEVSGLDGFLKLLDARRDVAHRERGLITVCNHVSVLDDPLIWGVLPFRYTTNPDNLRWSLGSHDLCYTNKLFSTFFMLGQTLPCHRLAHSPHGGLFQPTITQTIRLLSRGPFLQPTPLPSTYQPPAAGPTVSSAPKHLEDISDPFSSSVLTYTTNGLDCHPAPSAYASRRHAWVHIFPEGKVHQKDDRTMRYFKWGVARLILETDVCPDVVPMWIEGPQEIMHESREFPRFLPRIGKKVSVNFGDKLGEEEFGDLRNQWKQLMEREVKRLPPGKELVLGELTDELKYGKEAVDLRLECTKRVREAVLKLRRKRGWPDEDPKFGLAETYRAEGHSGSGRMDDGSWVKDI